MEDIKKWINENTMLAFGLAVALVVLVIVVFYFWLKDDTERMMQFKINTGLDKFNGNAMGNTEDPRFNLMKAEREGYKSKKRPADKPTSNIYALGQGDYDWLSWRPAHIRDLEMKERSMNIMKEPLTVGGHDASVGARDIYSRAEYAMHPANLPVYAEHLRLTPGINPNVDQAYQGFARPPGWGSSRSTVSSTDAPWRGLAEYYSSAERMESTPVAQSDNTHVFRGSDGSDITIEWNPSSIAESLNNQGQWRSELTTNPDEDVQLAHAKRELQLAQTLFGA